MYKEIVHEITKRYFLSSFEENILLALENKELTAVNICELTKIPKGRIYYFLNLLIEKKLIEKNDKNPATYSTKDFEEKVSDFLDRKELSNRFLERDMLTGLSQIIDGETRIIHNADNYKKAVIEIFKESKAINLVLRKKNIPPLFYPQDEKDYIAIRKELAKLRETFTGQGTASYLYHKWINDLSKHVKIRCVVAKDSLSSYLNIARKYFGQVKFNRFIADVLAEINSRNMVIKVVEESYPYHLYISGDRAIFALIYRKSIVGFDTNSKRIVEIYENIFKDLYAAGMPLRDFMKEEYGRV